MPKKKFRAGRRRDSDEKESHIRPEDITKSIEAPSGQFVDVPCGMVAVPGAIVDDKGIMRKDTGELAIWHHRCKFHGPCERWANGPENYVKEHEVVYINGAPWCPNCIDKMEVDKKNKVLQEIFRGKKEEN